MNTAIAWIIGIVAVVAVGAGVYAAMHKGDSMMEDEGAMQSDTMASSSDAMMHEDDTASSSDAMMEGHADIDAGVMTH